MKDAREALASRDVTPLEHLCAVLHAGAALGPAEIAAFTWFARAFWRFLEQDEAIGLTQFLGIPATPKRVRVAVRDAMLVRAAQAMGNPSDSEVRHAAEKFEGSKWPSWSKLGEPPHYATNAERALFYALRMHELPKGRTQWHAILVR